MAHKRMNLKSSKKKKKFRKLKMIFYVLLIYLGFTYTFYYSLKANQDIVLPGLGFIKCTKPINLTIYTPKRIKTYTEKYGSLLEMYPEIIREWDYEKNSGLDPNEITSHSSQKVWWFCPNGHSYKSSISHKVVGRGCPKCSKEKSISFPEKAIVYMKRAREYYNSI